MRRRASHLCALALAAIGCGTAELPDVEAPNPVPEVAITSHADGGEVLEGKVLFAGEVADDEPAEGTTARWLVDGEVVPGCTAPPVSALGVAAVSECSIPLVPGVSIVRLEVEDSAGGVGATDVSVVVVPRTVPKVSIDALADGTPFYSDRAVALTGTVSDGEDAPEALDVRWQSDLQGEITKATAATDGSVAFSDLLIEGVHELSLVAVDSDGNEERASIAVDVGPPNRAPTCAITGPTGGSAEVGAAVTFTADASDPDVGLDWLLVE